MACLGLLFPNQHRRWQRHLHKSSTILSLRPSHQTNDAAASLSNHHQPMPPMCLPKVRLCRATAISFPPGLAFVSLRQVTHHASRHPAVFPTPIVFLAVMVVTVSRGEAKLHGRMVGSCLASGGTTIAARRCRGSAVPSSITGKRTLPHEQPSQRRSARSWAMQVWPVIGGYRLYRLIASCLRSVRDGQIRRVKTGSRSNTCFRGANWCRVLDRRAPANHRGALEIRRRYPVRKLRPSRRADPFHVQIFKAPA